MRRQHLTSAVPKYLFLALCLLTVFVALLTLRNSTKILSSLDESTTNYVSDVAIQMTEQVDAHIESSLDTLQTSSPSTTDTPI